MNKQELLDAMRLAAGRRREAKQIADWAKEHLKETAYSTTPRTRPMTDEGAQRIIAKTKAIMESMGISPDLVPSSREELEEAMATGPKLPSLSFQPPTWSRNDGKLPVVFLRPEDADRYVPPPATVAVEAVLHKSGKHNVLFVRDQAPVGPFWIGLAALRVCLLWAIPANRWARGSYHRQSNLLTFGLINDTMVGGLRRTLNQVREDRQRNRIGTQDVRDRLTAEVQAKVPGPHPDNLSDILLLAVSAQAGHLIRIIYPAPVPATQPPAP